MDRIALWVWALGVRVPSAACPRAKTRRFAVDSVISAPPPPPRSGTRSGMAYWPSLAGRGFRFPFPVWILILEISVLASFSKQKNQLVRRGGRVLIFGLATRRGGRVRAPPFYFLAPQQRELITISILCSGLMVYITEAHWILLGYISALVASCCVARRRSISRLCSQYRSRSCFTS